MSKIKTMDEVLDLIHDGATIAASGFLLWGLADEVFKGVEDRFLQTGHPAGLTCVFTGSAGLEDSGFDRWAHDGLIDTIIMGPLDRFFDYEPGRFCIIHNWIEWHKCLFRRRPDIGNSSCFRFEAGGPYAYVYEKWMSELDRAQDQRFFRTEQEYMTYAVGLDRISWWPENYVRSFKRSCARAWPLNHFLAPRFDPDTSILCFHGHPSPEEAIAGYRGRHLNTWTKPCPWVEELWTR